MFIKDEPHSLKKVTENRFRLIHCLSLVDQMVDKVLFTPWYEAELRNPMATTQKTGWSPLPAGYQRLIATFPVDESIAVDKSLWDWTMVPYVIVMYVRMKMAQMQGEVPPNYWYLVWRRLTFVLGPGTRFRLSTGLEYRQLSWGIMKSGWLLTLSMNSAAQAYQHVLACKRAGWMGRASTILWAMGDDLLAKMKLTPEELKQYWQHLESTGCIVKKIEIRREFCGFLFNEDTVDPLYPDKHQFILRYMSGTSEQPTLLSYELLYALSQEKWIEKVRANETFSLGPMARLWARGLVNLEILNKLPEWCEY